MVTPYTAQTQVTLEALRDRKEDPAAATEVGTAHRFQGREFPVVVFDMVEDGRDERWMAAADRKKNEWTRKGVRLFTVAVTRARSRLYLIGSRRQLEGAPEGTPFGAVAAMLRARTVRVVDAADLLPPESTPDTGRPAYGPFTQELAEILAEHVRVAEIHDERSFYDVFAPYLAAARQSVWIWAPWTARRLDSLLPVLRETVQRGVPVRVFVRDPGDTLQGSPDFQQHVADLRAAGPP